jgi:hypothetical protein
VNTNQEVPTPSAVSSPPKSVDDLLAERGVQPIQRFEDLFGAGRELWSDEEFEAFLRHVRATRVEER